MAPSHHLESGVDPENEAEKVKSVKLAHTAGAYPGFRSMISQLRVLPLLPLCGMLVQRQDLPPAFC